MRELLANLLDWYLGALDQGGYLLVAALMAMESSIVPATTTPTSDISPREWAR